MATNIPPHNLGELVDVLCALIHNPDATVSALSLYQNFCKIFSGIVHVYFHFITS